MRPDLTSDALFVGMMLVVCTFNMLVWLVPELKRIAEALEAMIPDGPEEVEFDLDDDPV